MDIDSAIPLQNIVPCENAAKISRDSIELEPITVSGIRRSSTVQEKALSIPARRNPQIGSECG